MSSQRLFLPYERRVVEAVEEELRVVGLAVAFEEPCGEPEGERVEGEGGEGEVALVVGVLVAAKEALSGGGDGSADEEGEESGEVGEVGGAGEGAFDEEDGAGREVEAAGGGEIAPGGGAAEVPEGALGAEGGGLSALEGVARRVEVVEEGAEALGVEEAIEEEALDAVGADRGEGDGEAARDGEGAADGAVDEPVVLDDRAGAPALEEEVAEVSGEGAFSGGGEPVDGDEGEGGVGAAEEALCEGFEGAVVGGVEAHGRGASGGRWEARRMARAARRLGTSWVQRGRTREMATPSSSE